MEGRLTLAVSPLLFSLLWFCPQSSCILIEIKQGQFIRPLSWSVHCNFIRDGKCSEGGGRAPPLSPVVCQKSAVATLCVL
jgi:hypothetical protein